MSLTTELAALTPWCRQLPDTARVELLCTESPQLPGPADSLVVRFRSCLADATDPDLIELVRAVGELVIRVDGCATGHPPPAAARLAEVLAALGLDGRLQLWPAPGTGGQATARREELDVVRLPASRRQLVSWLRPDPAARRHAPSGPDADPPPEPPGAERPATAQQHVVSCLRALLGGRPAPPTAHELPSPALDLRSRGCVACGTCVRACPTGALELRSTQRTDSSDSAEIQGIDKSAGSGHPARVDLVLDPTACVGCQRCEILCPADALSDVGRISWGRLLTESDPDLLEALTTRVCERCRTEYAGDEATVLCSVCRMRQASPFGSVLPPRYLAPHVYGHPDSGAGPG